MLEDTDFKKLGYFFYNIYYDVFDTETNNLMIKLLIALCFINYILLNGLKQN